MSDTPHLDELRRLAVLGPTEVAAYHKANKEALLKEALLIHERNHQQQNTKKED